MIALVTPLQAIVGGAAPAEDADARSVVALVGARGNFCTAALVAPDVVLTAAHCVAGGEANEFRIVTYDVVRQPSLHEVRRVLAHSRFSMTAMLAHRASADVALLQLRKPLPLRPIATGVPQLPVQTGSMFRIVGIGVSLRGDGKSGGLTRSAMLAVTGRPGTLQIRLVDPATNNLREGLGACTGDSGAPVLQDQNGRRVLIGVVSWSTGPNDSSGCGGLTGSTPLTLYNDWILRTLESWTRF